MNFKLLNNVVGWLTFAIATVVYALTVEPTGSLWDCGEFVSAAYKLQVVHPPGAPLFLMIGRMFSVVADAFSADPSAIAYSINLLSGVSTAFLVLFIFWTTTAFAKLLLVGREEPLVEQGQIIAVLASGLVAGLSTTFATSVWFSAVEGEVYAMSGLCTGTVIWATMRWYMSSDRYADRWLIFIAYVIGLSIGVHLLSLLTIPFVAVMYYQKQVLRGKLKDGYLWAALLIGGGVLGLVQYVIIPQLPNIGAAADRIFVNSFGLPFGSGLIFVVLLLIGGIVYGLSYAHKKQRPNLQKGIIAFAMVLMGFSTYGTILIRASANTPINMNNPDNPYSLLSYLNREQYGDRPLFYGPHFQAQPIDMKIKGDIYRPVNGRYEKVGEKFGYEYSSSDMMLLPRMGHQDRASRYMQWMPEISQQGPTMAENISFLFRYQIGWMYIRYFMWNFVGRQNAQQGFIDGNKTRGNWLSGISIIDGNRLYDQSNLPKSIKERESRNTYYFLPLIFGLIGLLFHFYSDPKHAFANFLLFFMMGLAIIFFLNQPPAEPRERDYAFAGSIFVFCIWIGLSVVAIYKTLAERGRAGAGMAILASVLVLSAPIVMGAENWDDHSRANHYGARDYAVNFLESCEKNAIIFTHGDNDTYPLWYAQEVEGIRPDVRVINFSLLAVDWYINQLRRKINESPAVQMTIPEEAYTGDQRNQTPVIPQKGVGAMNIIDAIKFAGESHPVRTQRGSEIASFIPTNQLVIPIDKANAKTKGLVPANTPDSLIVDKIVLNLDKRYLSGGNSLIKDQLALLDIIATNAANGFERPIYFAVTSRENKIMDLRNYLQLEGLALRLVPILTPSESGGAWTMGRLNKERLFENLTEKFRWGNFNKVETFIDESYMPSVQMMQNAFIRLTQEYLQTGEKEKAETLLDQYFEAFPHMNFPYDENYTSFVMLSYYYDIGAFEQAKAQTKLLAETVADNMRFFMSLDQDELQQFAAGGQSPFQLNARMAAELSRRVANHPDEAFRNEIQSLLQPYILTNGQAQPQG